MAMVTKMETENALLTNEFRAVLPDINAQLHSFYDTFFSDVKELRKTIFQSKMNWHMAVTKESLSSDKKIQLYTALNESARAYGLSSDFVDFCGDLYEPAELKGDYLKEDPWCVHQPERRC